MSPYNFEPSASYSSNSESEEAENSSTNNTSFSTLELEASENCDNVILELNPSDDDNCQENSELPIKLPDEHQNTFYETLIGAAKTDNLKSVEEIELSIHENGPSLQRISFFMPNLRKLNCSGSSITSLRSIGSELDHLKILDISHCGLASLDGLMSLSNLEELYAESNEISDVGPCVFACRLRIVDFKRNNISDMECVGFLSLCPELRYVNFQECPVTMYPDYRRIVKFLIPQLISLDDIDFECRGSHSLPIENENCKKVDKKKQGDTAAYSHRNAESTQVDATFSNNSSKSNKSQNEKLELAQFSTTSLETLNLNTNENSKSNGFIEKGIKDYKLLSKNLQKSTNGLSKIGVPLKKYSLVTSSLEKIDKLPLSSAQNLKVQNLTRNIVKLPPIQGAHSVPSRFDRRPATSNCESREIKRQKNTDIQPRPSTSRNFNKHDYIEDLETIKKMLKNLPTPQNPFSIECTNEIKSQYESNKYKKNETTESLLEASRRWRVRSASYRSKNL